MRVGNRLIRFNTRKDPFHEKKHVCRQQVVFSEDAFRLIVRYGWPLSRSHYAGPGATGARGRAGREVA